MQMRMAYQHRTDDLYSALQHMQENNIHCDVTLMVEGQAYHVHKVILAARSSHFCNLFTNKPNISTFTLDNLRQNQVDVLIRYFYTEAFEVTKENVFDSLHLATRFELIHLEKQCEELMCSNLSAQNFVSILNTACDFQSPVLIARCVKYFEDNTAKVFQNRNTDLLQREALQHLLEWCQKLTGASEAELLQMVWRWGRAGLRKARHTAITARVDVVAYLGDLLRHIQFLHMPVQDFASYVTSKNIFPKEKEIEMFCYLAQPDAMRTSDLSQEQLQGKPRQIVPVKKVMLRPSVPFKPLLQKATLHCAICSVRIDSSVGREWVKCRRCPKQHFCLQCVVDGQHAKHREHIVIFTNDGHTFWCSLCGWDLRRTQQYSCGNCPDFNACSQCHDKDPFCQCGIPLFPSTGSSVDGLKKGWSVIFLYDTSFVVTDAVNDNVCRYSIRGQLMCSTKANKIKIDYPTGICRAHTSGGDYIVVCEWGKMRLLLLNETLDTVIRYISLPMGPFCVTYHNSGHLVVGMTEQKSSVEWCGAVHVITMDGQTQHRWSDDKLYRPFSVTVTPDDQIVISDQCKHKALNKRDIRGHDVSGFKSSAWTDIRGIGTLDDGRILVCYKQAIPKIGIVEPNGSVMHTQAQFEYRKEYGCIGDVSCHKGYAVIVFRHHIAVYKLRDLFPSLY